MLQTLIGPAVLTSHCTLKKFRCFLFSNQLCFGFGFATYLFHHTCFSSHLLLFRSILFHSSSLSLSHSLSIPFPLLVFANLHICPLSLSFYMCYSSDLPFPSCFSLSLSLSSSFCFLFFCFFSFSSSPSSSTPVALSMCCFSHFPLCHQP